jgi:hypothetical protein
MEDYPNVVAVTLSEAVAVDGNSRQLEQNTVIDYTGLVIFSDTAPPVGDVQSVFRDLLLGITAVQAVVDANPSIGLNASVEEVAFDGSGGEEAPTSSALALSGFSIVVNSDEADPVNEAQLTSTLQDYLTAGIMEDYPNAVAVVLDGNPRQMEQNTVVDYAGYVVFSDTAPPVGDVQSVLRELLLDITAVQALVDANPAIGQDVRVEQVTFDGYGGEEVPTSSVVALSDFSIVVNSDEADPVDVAQLTSTLHNYLTAGIMEDYPNAVAVAVVLDGNLRQMDQSTVVDYTGYVIFSDTAPPVGDVQSVLRELLLDTTAVQAAMDANPAIGQDVRVEQVTFDGSGPEDAPTVALPGFSVVISSNDANPVDVAQLTMTLEDYLTAGIMEEYPNTVAVVLDGNPRQMEQITVVDYTGHVVFSDTAAPAGDVQSLYRELLLDTTAVQAAVDANPAIGLNASVEKIAFDGSGGEDATTVALSGFSIVVTSDDTDLVNEAQLRATLEDYLTAGIVEDYPNAVSVTLDGSQGQMDQSIVVDYTGYVVFSETSPPSVQDVKSLEQELLLDITALQEVVDDNPAIGPNARVEEVATDENSAVALSDFTIVVTSDDSDPVDESQLTRTLQDYLAAGLMQDYPTLEAVMLQPQQLQQGNTVLFSGYALFSGSAPSFRELQSLETELLSENSAVQSAVDSNPAIGQNVRVVGVVIDEPVGDDDDDDNTAVIVGVVVGASAFLLALVAIFTSRRRINPEDTEDEEPPSASPTPPQGSIGTADAVALAGIDKEAKNELGKE